ncbi:VWA domain-containing protein [uncultured Deinococcus sp.]|uniref:VWA domain-containing protein n=1 Tax=uncultured Deinococcus sp. TaxID=158789 RepID=UPI00374899E8
MAPLVRPRPRSAGPLLAALCLGSLGEAAAQACVLPSSPPPSRSRVVFILDTSGSMQGLGDGRANIFARVQGAILRGMRAAQAPGSVELLTFDKGPRQRRSFAWPSQRGEFERAVNGIRADGSNTWLYTSMQSMFASLQSRDDTATTVYVLTDGIDNNPDRAATIATALAAFNVTRGNFDKLYYVGLGVQVPAEVKAQFAQTTFAQAVELPLNTPPDLTSALLLPGMVNVSPDASFAFRRPQGTRLSLESGNVGGGQVTILNPEGAGDRVKLGIQGSVPAGSVGYVCADLPDGEQRLLLRFEQTTPPPSGAPAPQPPALGTLRLLNPDFRRELKRGEKAVLRYQAVNGPVTVEVAQAPGEITAQLPDTVVSLLEGQQVELTLTDLTLRGGQQAASSLRLNNAATQAVPAVVGVEPVRRNWWWLLLLPVPLLLLLWWRREGGPFEPYALSVDRALRITLHERATGRRRSRPARRDLSDVGALFRMPGLRGIVLERYQPDIAPEDEVVLDNSDANSIRDYAAQRGRRALRLQAQPERLRLHKDTQPEGTFLELQETLALGQLYVFTPYEPPRARVRPAAPPPEPPIEVIVTLLRGVAMQDLELPLEDVDLADVFAEEGLRGLVVRREPGLLRLRALAAGMRLRHISREFGPGDALPLAVMLDLAAPGGTFQLRVRDKASMSRMRR